MDRDVDAVYKVFRHILRNRWRWLTICWPASSNEGRTFENLDANSGSIVSGILRSILFGCKKEEVLTLNDDGYGWIRGGILLACFWDLHVN
jgi:hypothetical protein